MPARSSTRLRQSRRRSFHLNETQTGSGVFFGQLRHQNRNAVSRKRLPTPSRRIEASAVPWIAATDAPDPFCSPANGSVFVDRLNEVVAASRPKAALIAEDRAQKYLVQPHRRYQYPSGQADQHLPDESHDDRSSSRLATRAARRGSDRRTSSKFASAPRFGRTTRSMPVGSISRCVRKASRISRFQRLRATALPTRRETDRPKREIDSPLVHPWTTKILSAANALAP